MVVSDEFVYGIWFAGLFLVIGIAIQILGSLFSDWRNHKRKLQYLGREHNYKIRFLKEEVFFKRKLQYFERILKEIADDSYKYMKLLAYSTHVAEQFAELAGKKKEDINQTHIKKQVEKLAKSFFDKEGLESFLPREEMLYLSNTDAVPMINQFITNHAIISIKLNEIVKEKKKFLKKFRNYLLTMHF